VVLASYPRPDYRFYNSDAETTTLEDPRLGPLPPCWERTEIGRALDGDDPLHCDFFRNTGTGEVINYDPRLEPDALRERGVKLERFELV
jgi:hypothetical protein